MAYLGSLKEMLNSGRLGPLYPGMPLRDVAEILGPPKYWTWNDFQPAPNYWMYGNFELFAEFGENPRCGWFQFDDAAALQGESEVINDDFIVMLDGLNARSRISDFIRAVDDIARVVVQLVDIAGYYNPVMLVGDRVCLDFTRRNDEPDEQVRDLDVLVRLTDRESKIGDIYSLSTPHRGEPSPHKNLHHLIISGADYLSFLKED